MRKLTVTCCLALAVGAFLYNPSGASAQGGDQDVREICTPDAMRVCSEFIPDADRVRVCMLRRRAQLSPACRQAMARSHGHYGRGHGRATYHHKYYHHKRS
jgi:hypothetical protein